jgi:hypothetical protein
VFFVNSDPALIRCFLRFLHSVGVNWYDLIYSLQIHETADVPAAERFWQEVTQANPRLFRRTTLKTHNPRTTRKNIGGDYHGCLRVEVRRSADLYRQIEGWAGAIMADAQEPEQADPMGQVSNLP